MRRELMACAGMVVMLALWAFDPMTAQEKPQDQVSRLVETSPGVVQGYPVPTLTEVQTLKLQNAALQAQAIQSQMALLEAAMRELRQNREALIQSIEREHPGWVLHRETLKWEKAPPAPAPMPPPVKK